MSPLQTPKRSDALCTAAKPNQATLPQAAEQHQPQFRVSSALVKPQQSRATPRHHMLRVVVTNWAGRLRILSSPSDFHFLISFFIDYYFSPFYGPDTKQNKKENSTTLRFDRHQPGRSRMILLSPAIHLLKRLH